MHEEPRAAFLPLPLIIHDDYYTVYLSSFLYSKACSQLVMLRSFTYILFNTDPDPGKTTQIWFQMQAN